MINQIYRYYWSWPLNQPTGVLLQDLAKSHSSKICIRIVRLLKCDHSITSETF